MVILIRIFSHQSVLTTPVKKMRELKAEDAVSVRSATAIRQTWLLIPVCVTSLQLVLFPINYIFVLKS
jgi:hypothetical protein